MKRIYIMGLGYVGLPTVSILSLKGFQLIGMDTNSRLVKKLNQVDIGNPEPGLAGLTNAATKSDRFSGDKCLVRRWDSGPR